MIIENIPISRPNNVVKKDWSVGRRASFSSEFCSDSTLLFRIQKNHYMAIHFWKNDFYTYYYDHIVNHMVPDLYIHLGEWYFIPISFFFTFSHFHEHGLCHFASLKYPGFLPTHTDLFFFFFFFFDSFPGIDDRLILPFILPPTISIALSLFVNHHRCFLILRSERDWCVSSCSKYVQYWVRLDGDHSIKLLHKLVG